MDMYKCMVKTYNLLNSIWQAHATVDLCVSMHSSSLGAKPGGFPCKHKLSSNHNLINLGIRQEIWETYSEKSILFFKLFGKIDFQIHKTLKNRLVF